ncbi:MAG: HAD family phosphatase [Lachnospiraceae bacterium]|jgi:putative hydrolase of the HAD superfamily|nr:HAD family phosphatase [Lachnospiraceae bacterium]
MITTIIFDIGNVLADFIWEEHYRSFGYDGEMFARIAKATVKSPVWNEYDRGVMSDEEILQGFIANDPELEDILRKVLANVKTMVRRNDYAIPWIKELQGKGYRCLYLSNFSQRAERECAEALDFIPHMDGGILSYQDQVIKPMPEIYQLLIDRYDLVPQECVFLDDTLCNLEAAEKFGIHTIHFKNQMQAIEELRKLGVDA